MVRARSMGEELLLLAEVGENDSSILEGPVKVGKDRVLGVIRVRSKVLGVVANHMISRAFVRGGNVTISMIFVGYDELRDVLKDFLKVGVNAKVLRVSKVSREEPLTVRQEQALVAALETGYFDYPRRVSLSELANRLGVSASTLDEVLRRAEKNVISRYLQGREI
ncbi:bacterio-opsin activator [Sulfodiicoccus acidiphilus]|uniref:Bacterio-opsin activator n=1 Tax=Sulfodiicoccus acidiphilus TaxID=1670455 RepID=A0A348B3D6_9CREN|nr:bacterio-opsin activator [Sulfodiicoccus acidiphilus]GGT95492.1 bacterio-opsin activator [Sulfodiicoccus acidiphilus]